MQKVLKIDVKDPLAYELFKEFVTPNSSKLSKEEADLVVAFLKDPVKGAAKILSKFLVVWYENLDSLLREENGPKSEKSILRMVKEYIGKKGWIREDRKREKRFVWEKNLFLFLDRNLPKHPDDLERLKEFKKALEEIKEKGVEDFLDIKTGIDFEWLGNELRICRRVAREILGKKVGLGSAINFDEAERIVEWLLKKWEKFVCEAEKRGWIYKDMLENEQFIWERNIQVSVLPPSEEERARCMKKIRQLKEALEELMEKGAENFLEITAESEMEIGWYGSFLCIDYELASKVLGREVKPKERLSLSEALRIVSWLLKRWEEDKRS